MGRHPGLPLIAGSPTRTTAARRAHATAACMDPDGAGADVQRSPGAPATLWATACPGRGADHDGRPEGLPGPAVGGPTGQPPCPGHGPSQSVRPQVGALTGPRPAPLAGLGCPCLESRDPDGDSAGAGCWRRSRSRCRAQARFGPRHVSRSVIGARLFVSPGEHRRAACRDGNHHLWCKAFPPYRFGMRRPIDRRPCACFSALLAALQLTPLPHPLCFSLH
jgi:hypothetical protein